MERTGQQYGRVAYCPYSDSSSSELQSYVRPFDTVRALHETVVSLRTALEESRREVDQLRQQISVRETVEQGRVSAGFRATDLSGDPRKQQSIYGVEQPSTSGLLKQPSNLNVSRESYEDISTTAVEDKKSKKIKKRKVKAQPPPINDSCSSPPAVEEDPKRVEDPVRPKKTPAKDGSSAAHQKVSVVPDIQIVSHPGGGTHSAMASRIDVKIKVSSNINMDGSSSEAESSECLKDSPTTPDAAADQTPEDDEKTIAEPDERGPDDDVTVREEVLKADGVENLRVSIVNEEQLSVSKSSDAISIKQISSENLHVDTDRQSNGSISEGDNSVFAEDPATANQPDGETQGTGPITGSYTLSDPSNDPRRRMKKSESENQEEVDDIELIFSSDDNAKDITQEDLVSISDYEPWHEAGQSGTPVLVSFTNLASDQEKMSSLERSDSEVIEGYELEKGKSLESQDSLSMDNIKKSMDFSTKSSSLEKDTSMDYGASGGTIIPALCRASSSQDDDGKQNDSFDVAGTNTLAAAGALGRRWTNYNVLIETDISKCGITEENILEMGRRNTCPNPPAYRPIIHPGSRMQPTGAGTNRSPLAVKFSRSPRTYSPHQYLPPGKTLRTVIAAESGVRGATGDEVKRSQAAQTDISALAQQWRSETHLTGSEYVPGLYTLPSKFVPPTPGGKGKFPLRPSDKTQEARRVLLSDINFTSMVPELSRSADHLCQHQQDENGDPNRSPNYCKGNLLRTPEATKGIPPSFSMTSPGVSQWTVNESSIATQTTQTDALWTNRGDSFDSSKSYSAGSRYSTLSKHHRSRSVPSMRCAICRQTHQNTALRPSESMHYTPRVTFQEQPVHKIRGSLPDLRHDCNCPRRYGGPSLYRIHGDSGGSTDSLLEEAEEFLRRSLEGGNMLAMEDSLGQLDVGVPPPATAGLLPHITFHAAHAVHAHPPLHHPTAKHRRCSENDIQRDYIPSKQALPFLPKTPKCLKPGHLAKVISPNGRVIVGRVRYIGPVAGTDTDDTYVGLQLPNNLGDCDGTIDGKRFFECEPLHGIFVPFKKVVMAWNS
ncbi:uncharacterized protein LOC128708613 [Anopheles marshallii]|uniref:uncharacterized protein LOC128708613 n=1 Tax=Anopheles marshallii TaxID=1521116 RepID=UPI00237C36F4|nr:uncharacterized protein LOC128708613 [Anopheles marshallii]